MTLHARVVEALLAETAEHQAFADAYGRRRAKELAALASELADKAIVPIAQEVNALLRRNSAAEIARLVLHYCACLNHGNCAPCRAAAMLRAADEQ